MSSTTETLIADLGIFSNKAVSSMIACGIRTVTDLQGMTRKKATNCLKIRTKTLKEIEGYFKSNGIDFAPEA